jgi:hypothetical protein
MSDELKWIAMPGIVVVLAFMVMFALDEWQDSKVAVACIEAGGEVAQERGNVVCTR